MLDPAIGALLAGLFALLFAVAAAQKLRAPSRFTEALAAYRLVPAGVARFSVLVPVLEALLALGLLMRATRVAAASTGAVLLVAYAAAIAVNLRRGRHDLACGCGGPNERRPIARWMVARNLLLAAALAAAALPRNQRPIEAADLLTIVDGTLITALIYASLDRLLSRVSPRGARLQGLA